MPVFMYLIYVAEGNLVYSSRVNLQFLAYFIFEVKLQSMKHSFTQLFSAAVTNDATESKKNESLK